MGRKKRDSFFTNGSKAMARHQAHDARIRRTIDAQERGTTGWSPEREEPPTVGFVDGDHLASFKQGHGANSEHTLIADGDLSNDNEQFKDAHNHYGRKREGGGYFSEDRGHYSGPGF